MSDVRAKLTYTKANAEHINNRHSYQIWTIILQHCSHNAHWFNKQRQAWQPSAERRRAIPNWKSSCGRVAVKQKKQQSYHSRDGNALIRIESIEAERPHGREWSTIGAQQQHAHESVERERERDTPAAQSRSHTGKAHRRHALQLLLLHRFPDATKSSLVVLQLDEIYRICWLSLLVYSTRQICSVTVGNQIYVYWSNVIEVMDAC